MQHAFSRLSLGRVPTGGLFDEESDDDTSEEGHEPANVPEDRIIGGSDPEDDDDGFEKDKALEDEERRGQHDAPEASDTLTGRQRTEEINLFAELGETEAYQAEKQKMYDRHQLEWLEHEEPLEDEDELGDDVAGKLSESNAYEAMGDDFAAHQRQTRRHARLMVGRERDPNQSYASRGAMDKKDFFRDAPETQAARTRDAPMQTTRRGGVRPELNHLVESFGDITREIATIVTLAGNTLHTDDIVLEATELREEFANGHDQAVKTILERASPELRAKLQEKVHTLVAKSLQSDVDYYESAIAFTVMERSQQQVRKKASKDAKRRLDCDIAIAEKNLEILLLEYVFEAIQETLGEAMLWTSDEAFPVDVRALVRALNAAWSALADFTREKDAENARRSEAVEKARRDAAASRAAAEEARMKAARNQPPPNLDFLYGPKGIVRNDADRAQEEQRVAKVSAEREAARVAAAHKANAQRVLESPEYRARLAANQEERNAVRAAKRAASLQARTDTPKREGAEQAVRESKKRVH
jgi:hypothetical protein